MTTLYHQDAEYGRSLQHQHVSVAEPRREGVVERTDMLVLSQLNNPAIPLLPLQSKQGGTWAYPFLRNRGFEIIIPRYVFGRQPYSRSILQNEIHNEVKQLDTNHGTNSRERNR